MTGEASIPPPVPESGPEREPLPEYRLFNLDAMTDEQIVMTGCGYLTQCDVLHHLGQHDEAGRYFKMARDTLGEDFGRLARRHPYRAKRIIQDLREGMPEAENSLNSAVPLSLRISYRENVLTLAAYWSPHVAPVDYEFARDMLLDLRETTEAGRYASEDLHNFITPDQAEDFRRACRWEDGEDNGWGEEHGRG